MNIIKAIVGKSPRYHKCLPAALIAISTLTAPTVLGAQENDRKNAIAYTVKRGDTLGELTNKYVRPEISYRLIQKYNGIDNERSLRVGYQLLLPRQYLRFNRSNAQILSLRGDISIRNPTSNDGRQYKVGDVISEGAVINTGRSSFMSLALEDGSQVSLPSNSNVRLRRMRRYVLERAIDYDFDITKGGSRTKVAPLRGNNDRFQVRTPKSVSAVRGTEFQMRVDDSNENSISEVVEGALAVTNIINNSEASLPSGNGWAVTKTGDEILEPLLPAPELIEATKTQKDNNLNFRVKPQAGANKYRIAFAADASFIEQFEDKIIEGTELNLSSIDNGRYYIRASAISPNGIEGLYKTYSFKRRLNSVSAEAGKDENGFAFKWAANGEGNRSFHFQLYASDESGKPTDNIAVIDEAGLQQNNITISELAPGQYSWRLGTTLFDAGEADTSWTDYQTLAVGAD